MAAAGFQLDQLLAACAQLAQQPNEHENISCEAQQQDQEADEPGAVLEGSEDADDLYADLQQPTGASTSLELALTMHAYVVHLLLGRLLCITQPHCVNQCRCSWRSKQRARATAAGADTAGVSGLLSVSSLTKHVYLAVACWHSSCKQQRPTCGQHNMTNGQTC
jgi:hypothetical protein